MVNRFTIWYDPANEVSLIVLSDLHHWYGDGFWEISSTLAPLIYWRIKMISMKLMIRLCGHDFNYNQVLSHKAEERRKINGTIRIWTYPRIFKLPSISCKFLWDTSSPGSLFTSILLMSNTHVKLLVWSNYTWTINNKLGRSFAKRCQLQPTIHQPPHCPLLFRPLFPLLHHAGWT